MSQPRLAIPLTVKEHEKMLFSVILISDFIFQDVQIIVVFPKAVNSVSGTPNIGNFSYEEVRQSRCGVIALPTI